MSNDNWNAAIKSYPTDRLFAATFGKLFPPWVRPNQITVFRMFLTPLVVLFLASDNFEVGVPLFLLAALSDWFDGALARTRKMITAWGIIYDPLADKLLIGSVLIVIVLSHINFTLGLLLVGVEAFIIIIGWIRVLQGKIEPANIWGKIKMVSEVVGIMLLLIALWLKTNLLVDLSAGTLGLAIVFAIVSILTRIK